MRPHGRVTSIVIGIISPASSAEIYLQVPLDVMLDVFPGMHALSPEMAVGDLKELSR